MSRLELLLQHPAAQTLGWTLLHFLWQGAVLALLLCVMLALLRHRTASARYFAACLTLLLMSLCPVTTFLTLRSAAETPAIPAAFVSRTTAISRAVPAPTSLMGVTIALPTAAPETPVSLSIARLLPYVVGLWLLGVLILSLRMLGGWITVQRLARRHTQPLPDGLLARMEELAERMGVHHPVRLLASAAVQVPTVFGCVRTVILLPIGILIGLAPEQVEALLAHELAHVRRHDYLVNLWQTGVETVLFYHPAVWWVSQRIRVERENCCDDLAVALLGNRRTYVHALTSLEQLRAAPPALAASDGDLLSRIQRLLGEPTMKTSSAPAWLAGSLVLTLFVTAAAALQLHPTHTPKHSTHSRAEATARTPAHKQTTHTQAHKSATRLHVYPPHPSFGADSVEGYPSSAQAHSLSHFSADARSSVREEEAEPEAIPSRPAASLPQEEEQNPRPEQQTEAQSDRAQGPPAEQSDAQLTLQSLLYRYQGSIRETEAKRAQTLSYLLKQNSLRRKDESDPLPRYYSLLNDLQQKKQPLQAKEQASSLYDLIHQRANQANQHPHEQASGDYNTLLHSLTARQNKAYRADIIPNQQKQEGVLDYHYGLRAIDPNAKHAAPNKRGDIVDDYTQRAALRLLQKTTTRVIPLKYTDSAQMLEWLTGGRKRGQLPTGIERLLHDPRTNSLIAQGTPAAIDALKKRVALLDQSEGQPAGNGAPATADPAQNRQKVPILSDIPLVGQLFRKENAEPGILLELRLVRFTFEKDGSWDVETVSNPKVITPNDTTATIEVQDAEAGFVVSLKPHIEPNGQLTIQGELKVRDDANSLKAYPAKFRQQVGQNMKGRRIPLTGVTDARSGAIRKSVEMGRIPPTTPAEGSVLYYLQLTRVELTIEDSQRPADGGR